MGFLRIKHKTLKIAQRYKKKRTNTKKQAKSLLLGSFFVFGLRRVAAYRAPAKLSFVGRGRIAVVQCRKRQSIRQAYSDDEVGEYLMARGRCPRRYNHATPREDKVRIGCVGW